MSQPDPRNTPGPAAAVLDFFCSLKLTIITLILLAATSIIGTVLPQDPGQAAEFKKTISESTWRLCESLGFFDMYHSWWFLALLGIFSLNLIACSVKRLPQVWKAVNEPVLTPDDAFLRAAANSDTQTLKKPLAVAQEQLCAFLTTHFATPVVTAHNGKVYLYAQKTPWARFGVYVTHVSILLIFVGAIIGNLWGYKAYVNIVEGTETSQVWSRGSREPIELGFSVRCDEFSVAYYPNSQRPKEFRSVLTVREGGQTVIDQRPIVVNDPLTYRGITFYQSSYGPTGEGVYRFRVTERATGRTVDVSGQEHEHIALPGGGALIPLGYADSYQNLGAAAQVAIDSGNHQHGNPFVVLQNYPDFDQQRGGAYGVALLGFEQSYYTGLQVAKDPGVWVVWAGCFLMVAGSMVAFFLSHRRVWVVLTPNGAQTEIAVAASAHRNQPGFALYFDTFKQQLQQHLSA